jgi:polyisoprenoid-binding protein YceI
MNKSKISNHFILLFLSILLFSTSISKAQSLMVVPQSAILSIHGTSNLHDWDMDVTKIEGELGINSSGYIISLVVKIPVSSLDSGKGIMNRNTKEVFEAKKFPNIVFQITEANPIKISEKEAELSLTGNLTMHGETRKISFKSMAKINKTGDYQLKGSVPLKMTDYKMKPPVALFGVLKTADAITLKFDVTYK